MCSNHSPTGPLVPTKQVWLLIGRHLLLGSYDLAWKLIVGMGLTAGLAQLSFALASPLPQRLATS
jgi:hypothetical protein